MRLSIELFWLHPKQCFFLLVNKYIEEVKTMEKICIQIQFIFFEFYIILNFKLLIGIKKNTLKA